MTVHVLPVPSRLAMVHQSDPELLDRVREAKRKLCMGEDISDSPIDLTNVTTFRGRITARWRRDDEKPLYQRMIEAQENARG